jgi:DNA topoisomerase-1
MKIAQQLYEGLEIGREGNEGLITYMRTDSVRVSLNAEREAREFIAKKWGRQFVPSLPPKYRSKRGAQEAHEAIRPTSVSREPDAIKEFLTPEQYKLYLLIWNRFVASQMKPALFLNTTVDIKVRRFLFRARGSQLIFAGFTIVYTEEKPPEELLPALSVGELLRLIELIPRQHFTEPPPRFSDASLVKVLEEKGIGRPSTYAPIISTIVTRDYVRRVGGYFHPTELGEIVNELLVKYFPRVLDSKFTATLEEELDDVEVGKLCWKKVLESFYKPFSQRLNRAEERIKKEIIPTKEICELCGKRMVIKWGRRGKFLSCSAFPQCKNAKPISTGIRCPNKDCLGELVERRSKKGKFFYGCTNYPKCTYTSRNLPQEDNIVH